MEKPQTNVQKLDSFADALVKLCRKHGVEVSAHECIPGSIAVYDNQGTSLGYFWRCDADSIDRLEYGL